MIPIQVPMTVANDEVELSMSASVNNVQFSLDAGTGIVAIADYERLNHKPQINSVELVGNKTAEDLGLATPADIPTKTSELENDSGYITDAGVTSFNGQTGAVTYSAPVSSVNGQTGDVTISVPTKTSELQNDSGFITGGDVVTSFNGQTGDITYSAPVTSVNGQTGAVSLTIPTVPTDVSAFNNDAGYITTVSSSDVTNALGYTPYSDANPSGFVDSAGAASAAPVQSVNGQTGAVTTPNDKTEQIDTTTSGYSNWRAPLISYGSVGTWNGSIVTTTNSVRHFNNLRYQPSTGTLRTTKFVGALEGTASGNLTSSSTLNPANLSGVTTGTTQFLREDGTWATPAYPSVPSASSANPADLGTATPGTSTDYARADHVHNKPTYSKSDVGLGNVDNVQQYSASNPPPYPVTSVNSQTGDVTLSIPSTAADVGALPDDTKYAGSATVGGVATKTASIPFGKLDGTSTATVMTAQVSGITELKSGVCMWLMNGVVTGGSNFTLNINGLGAKPVYQSQAAAGRVSSVFNINYTALMIYNEDRVAGGCWDYVYGYDTNTNTIGYQVRTNSTSLPMTSIVYRYRLLFQSADNAHYVPANNSTSTNATTARTVCQDKINPFGRIVYYGTTASVAAGSRPSTANLWQQYAFTFGYSFQKSPNYELTEWKPIYLKCDPQSDGSAIIDSTTPFTQDLPTTDDGKIYIFLGIAYSTTAMELTLEHPVYWYKNGRIRQYTDAAPELPAVTSADNGKFLVVDNGSWTAMTLSTWQGGSY